MTSVRGITVARAVEIANGLLFAAELNNKGELLLIPNGVIPDGNYDEDELEKIVNVGRVAETLSDFNPSIVSLSAFDTLAQEVCVPEWWSPRSGNAKLSDPDTIPTGAGAGAGWSPDGKYLAVAHASSPYLTIYKRSGDTFTKLSDPATLPASNGTGISWSPDGRYLAVTHLTSPYVMVYKRAGDVFTKLANPTTLPAGNATSVAWSSNGAYLAVGFSTTPYLCIYSLASDVLTYLAPTTFSNSAVNALIWDGLNRLIVGHTSSPYLSIYSVAVATSTFQLAATQPSDKPSAKVNGLAMTPDGKFVAAAYEATPFVFLYSSDGAGTYTKLTAVDVIPPGNGTSCRWSPDGRYLTVGHALTPFFSVYKRRGNLLFKVPDLSSLPPSTVNAVAWSPGGTHLALPHSSSPYLALYKSSMTQPEGAPAVTAD